MNHKYLTWERGVIDEVIVLLGVPNGDAQSILEVNHHFVAQEWTKGSSPNQAAKNIIYTLNQVGDEKVFLFVPVQGYFQPQQKCIPASQLSDSGFEEELQWAEGAEWGESKTIRSMGEICVLIRIK